MGVRRHSGVLVNIWRGAWLLGVAEHHREGEKGCKGYSGVGDKKARVRIFVGATSDGEVMSYGKSRLNMLRYTCLMTGDQNRSGRGVRVIRQWFRRGSVQNAWRSALIFSKFLKNHSNIYNAKMHV